MNITIPLFALRRGQTSGLESATFNVMRGLAAIGTGLRVALTNIHDVPEPVARWLISEQIPIERYPRFGKSMSLRFAEETLFGLLTQSTRILSPNYFLPPRGPRHSQRAVVIHDLQHKHFPENFERKKVAWLDYQFRRTLRRSDRIMFISRFELEQARRYYGDLAGDRASVIYNAIDWSRFQLGEVSRAVREAARKPFILSVAQDYPHKRLPLLIKAFRHLAKTEDDLRLLLVGRATENLRELAQRELGPSAMIRIGFLGFVSDADLAYLYSQASLFALPSAYEGFGMPAVEAMGFGCRVLVTNATALPEVTLGRADYLPLQAKPEEWAETMKAILQDGSRVSLELQQEIRRRFDPLVTAKQIQAIFDT